MADKPEEAKKEPPGADGDPEDGPEEKGKGPLIVMLLGLLIGVGAGVFVVGPMLAGSPEATEADEQEEHDAEDGEFHSHVVEGLIVNPAGTGGTRLLLISVAIEVDSETTVEEAADRGPEIRDVLLSALSTKTIAELTDPGAREALRVELLEAIRGLAFEGELLYVHIPQFVGQ